MKVNQVRAGANAQAPLTSRMVNKYQLQPERKPRRPSTAKARVDSNSHSQRKLHIIQPSMMDNNPKPVWEPVVSPLKTPNMSLFSHPGGCLTALETFQPFIPNTGGALKPRGTVCTKSQRRVCPMR